MGGARNFLTVFYQTVTGTWEKRLNLHTVGPVTPFTWVDSFVVPIAERGQIRYKADKANVESTDKEIKLDSNKVETPKPANKIRTDFRDTWLWQRAVTGSNGKVSTLVRLPDTITSWDVSAFAINSEGLAYAAKPVSMRGFQPFFLSMNLPYSIKRGEVFALRITVFNYRSDDINAIVRLRLSPMFTVNDDEMNKDGWAEAKVAIKRNLASSVEFQINATTIGEIELEAMAEDVRDGQKDQVIRKLRVKPEGVPRMHAETAVMIVDDTPELLEIFPVVWPPVKIVPDSKRVQVKVTGEIFGQALSGLERLVVQPYGCGEQNMISTVPNIFGLTYIKSTEQKNMEVVEAKLLKNMKIGYSREVDNYRHSDGSYSAWGPRDKHGSTWLTAFVIKSFAAASVYANVDDSVLQSGINFILSKQTDRGAFEEHGKVLHSDMQSGTGHGFGLSVYVLISMLETREALGTTSLNNKISLATSYILSEINKDVSMTTFTRALTAYALSLLPKESFGVQDSINDLLTPVKDSDVPWNNWDSTAARKTTGNSYDHYGMTSVVLQTSAYLLLTYIRLDRYDEAMTLMKWIQAQQNSRGGFISTQDTVLVLQALSEYGRLVRNSKKDGRITVEERSLNFRQDIDISGERTILLQIVDLPANTNEIHITLAGSANTLAVAKVVQYYYEYVDESKRMKGTYDILRFEENVDLKIRSYQRNGNVHQIISCVKSSLPTMDKMYINTLNLPSGERVVDTESVLLMKNEHVTRVEIEEECIHFYTDKLQNGEMCVQADIERQMEFTKQLSGSAQFYDYYAPEQNKEIELTLDGSPVCTSDPCDTGSAATLTSVLLSVIICTLVSLLMCV